MEAPQLVGSDSNTRVLINLLDQAHRGTVQVLERKGLALQFAFNRIDVLIQTVVLAKVFLDVLSAKQESVPLSEKKSTSISLTDCFNPAPTIPLAPAEAPSPSEIYAVGMLVYFAAMASYFGVPQTSR